MQPFKYSPQYQSHDFAQSGQMAMTSQHQHQKQPAAAAQHSQLDQQRNKQFGQMGGGQNEYNQQLGQIGQNQQVGVNERGLIVHRPQGIKTANVLGNPQGYTQQHFRTQRGFTQMNTQPQQPAPQIPEPPGYQNGCFGPALQPQTQAQAVGAHGGQAQRLAQGFNQFGSQIQGLFEDAQGQRPGVRLPSVTVKTPGKTNAGTTATPPGPASKASATNAANKPVEKAKGTMVNGLFYPEGQSPAEKAAAAKKKTPFVAKGMFVASPNSHLSSSNSPYYFFLHFVEDHRLTFVSLQSHIANTSQFLRAGSSPNTNSPAHGTTSHQPSAHHQLPSVSRA